MKNCNLGTTDLDYWSHIEIKSKTVDHKLDEL